MIYFIKEKCTLNTSDNEIEIQRMNKLTQEKIYSKLTRDSNC